MSVSEHHQLPPADQPEAQSLLRDFSMRDVFYLVFRHKRKIMLGMAVGLLAALAVATGSSAKYKSEAKLLVRFVRESVKIDPSAKGDSIISGTAWENVINSEMEIIMSRELAEKAVVEMEALGTTPPPAPPETARENVVVRAAQALGEQLRHGYGAVLGVFKAGRPALSRRERAILDIGSNLELVVPKYQNIIHVSYVAKTPQQAQAVLAKLVDLYLEKHMDVHRAKGSYEFFLEQAIRIEQEMAEKQELLRHMKNKLQLASLETQKQKLSDRMAALHSVRQEKDSALAACLAGLGVLENNLAELQGRLAGSKDSPAILPTFMARTYENIVELQLREQELLVTYTEDSAAVQNVRQQIKRLQDVLIKNESELRQPAAALSSASEAYTQTLLSLLKQQQARSSLEAEVQIVKTQLAEVQQEIETMNDGEVLVGRLQRELVLLQDSYQKYFDLAEQARIDQAKEAEKIANISVVQPASLPLLPVVSNRGRNAALVLMLCVLGGLGSAFFTENYLDHTLKTPEQVEQLLEMPALVSIPLLKSGRRKLSVDGQHHKPMLKPAAEENKDQWDLPPQLKNYYDSLCERLQAVTPRAENEPVIIGVTSCSGREGVSTVAANLAVALAGGGRQVILVEANVGHPTAHELFGDPAAPGIAEINVDGLGQTRVLQHNLYLLPAASVGQNVSQASMPQMRCEELVRHLNRLDGGYVVVDMPPLNESASAMRLARQVHNVVLVVEAERSRREVVSHGLELLAGSHAHILGVVLNKRRYHIPSWVYNRI